RSFGPKSSSAWAVMYIASINASILGVAVDSAFFASSIVVMCVARDRRTNAPKSEGDREDREGKEAAFAHERSFCGEVDDRPRALAAAFRLLVLPVSVRFVPVLSVSSGRRCAR